MTTTTDIVTVESDQTALPPGWALMQRHLIETMEESTDLFAEKYMRRDRSVYYVQDVDDIYEVLHNWGLFYAIGADRRVLDVAVDAWNATTRYYDDALDSKRTEPDHPFYMSQLHNEWWNLNIPYNSDWFHMGEGSQSFYDFGLADPGIHDYVRRTRRFAGMYIGEDPDAPNYDPTHKVFRSPYHGGEGPLLRAGSKVPLGHSTDKTTEDIGFVKRWLEGEEYGGFSHRSIIRDWERWAYEGRRPNGLDSHMVLYPTVKELEPFWFDDPDRAEEIVRLFEKMALQADTPENLGATALATHAYILTGDDKYKDWVTDYVEAWMDRIAKNGGIIPDNIGPTGQIGEHRDGQWWGGLDGWNTERGAGRIMMFVAVAAECALLLTGDTGYLDMLRSQLDVLIDNSITREDGQLLIPNSYGPNGWSSYQLPSMYELSHLYHGSLSSGDYDTVVRLRDGERERDWNEVEPARDRRSGQSEFARFQYYDGKNPDWPAKVLEAEYLHVMAVLEAMREDSRDTETIISDNRWPPYNHRYPGRKDYGCEGANPLVMKGLTQVTMGTPQNIYNGGLCRGTVRYFDQDRSRPGLPLDVAALVDELRPDGVGIRLVNTSTTEARRLIVQAGVFGEHRFTELQHEEIEGSPTRLDPFTRTENPGRQVTRTTSVDSKHFAVDLAPSAAIRIDAGLKRFVNQPSYASPFPR